ncbi:MAG: hypothetical protein HeimC3_46270 [Candidatus Heimdallarchaeota archaeon LC_3]|nr:MAG: hypothetical protein HeimC3_46270 [Candidatus Heimdallarchaeota archaeon LC_3]
MNIAEKKHNYPDKSDIVFLIDHGCTYREMQKRFNISAGTMYRALKFYGLKTKNMKNSMGKSNKPNDIEKTLELRKQGKSLTEIAKEFDISEASIYARLKKYYPEYLPISNRYTREEIEKMRDLRQRGYSYQSIADKLDRSVMGIYQNLNRRFRFGNETRIYIIQLNNDS